MAGLRGGLRGHGPTLLLDHMLTFAPIPGADPEILHGGWLSGWLPILYYTELWGVADRQRYRSTPIVLCTNKQVKGGWLATHPPPLNQPLYTCMQEFLTQFCGVYLY